MRTAALQEGIPMFLLSNINDRRYSEVYIGLRNVAFDMSEIQLRNAKNRDWNEINPGSIVCVVNSTRKISTFRRIEERRQTELVDNESGTLLHVIIGPVIGKLPQDLDMTTLLNNHRVDHPYLPRNVFSNGFNVANLGDALDAVMLTSRTGNKTIAELERGL
jgi:hypothetical protein